MDRRRGAWSDSPLEDFPSIQHPPPFQAEHPHLYQDGFLPNVRTASATQWEYPIPNCVSAQHVLVYPCLGQEPPPLPPVNFALDDDINPSSFAFINLNNGFQGVRFHKFRSSLSSHLGAHVRGAGPFSNGSTRDWVYPASGDEEMNEAYIEELEEESGSDNAHGPNLDVEDQRTSDFDPDTLPDGAGNNQKQEADEDVGSTALYETVKSLWEEVEAIKLTMHRERAEFERLDRKVDEMLRYLRSIKHRNNRHDRAYQDTYEQERASHGCCEHGDHDDHNTRHAQDQDGYHQGESTPSAVDMNPKPAKMIEDYNTAWKAILESDNGTRDRLKIPWPTANGQVSMLSQQPRRLRGFTRHKHLPRQISEDIFQLRRWNTFSFFARAYGLQPKYGLVDSSRPDAEEEEARDAIVFDIQSQGATRDRLNALKAQLMQEKLRWHPDRLRRLKVSLNLEEQEAAKAVLSAVLDISKSCSGRLEDI